MSEAVHQLQPGSYGPPVAGGRSPALRVLRRVLTFVTAFVGVMALGVGAAAGYLVWQADVSLSTVNAPGLGTAGAGNGGQAAQVRTAADEEEGTPAEATGVVNVLVVGSDSREGLSDEDLQRLGTEDEGGSELTDTVMVVQLNADAKKVAVLGFPRDLVVTRCDDSRGRINGAYEIGESEALAATVGGPGCLIETIKTLTGMQIDHYVEMNLLGFIGVVDAIGGVTFYVDEPLQDRAAGLDVGAGCQEFDGYRALGFVRARRLDSDFGRIARQQRFMRELIDEATSLETVSNPLRLSALVRSVASAVTVDQDLSLSRMASLAYTFRDLRNAEIATFTAPARDGSLGAAAVEYLNEEQAAPIFAAFRRGTAGNYAREPEETPPVTLATIGDVMVLNGAGQEGLATLGKVALEERGVTVGVIGDAGRYSYVTTQIEYPASMRPQADLLADVLPDARLEVNEERDELTVVLGADFDANALPEPDPSEVGSEAVVPTEAPQPEDFGASGESAPAPVVGPTQTPEFEGGQLSAVECG